MTSGNLHCVVLLDAPDIKTETTQRPMDSHLLAQPLRGLADRWLVGAPLVAVVEEFAGDEDDGGELERCVAVPVLAVG
jgi:hypothetical protein